MLGGVWGAPTPDALVDVNSMSRQVWMVELWALVIASRRWSGVPDECVY
jgi:hypothetical protein